MSKCLGCVCTAPGEAEGGGRLLLATRVSHHRASLRSLGRELGASITEREPGLLEVGTTDVGGFLAAAEARLSSVEAAEVRALRVGAESGDALLAAAMAAPSLAQLNARVAHADLLPLFADEQRAFRSVYQPIVALGTAQPPVIGYEALLRAQGATGQIMPAELFGAAAAAGWLHVLDRVGRTTALRGAAGWLGQALLFVNFLPTTIYRPEVCLHTTELAAATAGLRLDQLVFEVTESEQVTDLGHLEEVFTYYRERGCKVALDDLGAGYSSLNLLVRLQPDIVKLDKEIVQRLPDPVSTAVVAAVVEITHAYGGQVLAECVETADQASAALDLGVDLGQGWFFGRPQERVASPALEPVPTALVAVDGNPGVAGSDTAVAITSTAVLVPEPPGGIGPFDVRALLSQAVGVCSAAVTVADAQQPDTPLVYVNQAFQDHTGYRAADVLGRNCRFLQGPDTDRDAVRSLAADIRAGRDHVSVLLNYRSDGTPWWNELRVSPVHDAHGRLTHYFGFQNDVTARVAAERAVTHQAFHDQLTGLPNRAHLMTELGKELRRASETGSQVALLSIDLDGFKAVNDELGHAAGDLVLIAAGARLRDHLRDGDLLGRLSGDEFLAVIPGVRPDLARDIARRMADVVIDSFHSPLQVSERALHLGASVGVALFPDHGSDATELLRAADQALYRAKAAGRGRAVLARSQGPETHEDGADLC